MKLNVEAQFEVLGFASRDAVFDNADRLMEVLLEQGVDSPSVSVSIESDVLAIVEIEYRSQGRSVAAVRRTSAKTVEDAVAAVGWMRPADEVGSAEAAGYAKQPVVAAA